MCVGMLKHLQTQNNAVENLIMDNDSTTLARVRNEVDASMKKKKSVTKITH